MSTFYAFYPPASAGSGNASVGPNLDPIPADSTLIGGENPSGELQPLQTDVAGNLLVSIADEPSPKDVNLIQVGGAAISEGQKTMANSLPVVLSSDQSAVHTIVDSSALPSGAATSANQVTEIASLATITTNTGNTATNTSSIDGKMNSLGQKAMAASMPVALASDQSAIPVTVASLPLPSGAATAANQATEIASLASIDTKTPTVGQKAMTASSPVVIASDQSAVPVSGTITVTGVATAANQTNASQKTQIVDGSGNVIAATSNSLNVAVQSSALPTGAATETTLAAINTKTPALGQAAMAASSPVVIASNQSSIPVVSGGLSAVNHVTNNYTSSPVTTAAYTQILASTSAAVKEVEIFDSSGQSLVLAIGAAASEVDQIYIFPGGNGRVSLAIATSIRVSIKAVSANATSGNIYVNFYG